MTDICDSQFLHAEGKRQWCRLLLLTPGASHHTLSEIHKHAAYLSSQTSKARQQWWCFCPQLALLAQMRIGTCISATQLYSPPSHQSHFQQQVKLRYWTASQCGHTFLQLLSLLERHYFLAKARDQKLNIKTGSEQKVNQAYSPLW